MSTNSEIVNFPTNSSQKASLYSAKNDSLLLICLSLFGIVVAVLTLEIWQGEDVGIFLSEVSLIDRGHKLYSEIYEIKDPLFLFSGALAYSAFGITGPFILDALVIALTAPIGFIASRTLGFSVFSSIFGAVLFIGSISGLYFQSFRSGTIALLLILMSFIFSARNSWVLFGILCVAVIGFKMSYALFLIGPLLLILKSDRKVNDLIRFLLSMLACLFLFLFVLFMRGELAGYFEMIISNFEYRSIYPEIVGLPTGLIGHIALINGYGSNFYLLAAIFCLQVVSSFKYIRSEFKMQSLSLCLVAFACLLTLAISAMWPHHLQILCFFAWSAGIILSESILENVELHNSITSLMVIPLLLITVLSGWSLPTGFKNGIPNGQLQVPPEAKYIKDNTNIFKNETKYARLGPNDDMGLAAFLPESWRLACRDYSTYGHESIERISEITTCIRDKPDVLIVSPGFIQLTRPAGNYEILKQDAMKLIEANFSCTEINSRPGALVCKRESG
jgi:hypothetical protein